MHEVYNDPATFALMVMATAKKVRSLKKKLHFDAIAFTGMIGAAMAYTVSVSTGIPLIAVRKTKKGSHCNMMVEGSCKIAVRSYIIIDDFIGTGSTIRQIKKKIKASCIYGQAVPECVGVVLYMYMATNQFTRRVDDIPIYKVSA